MTKDAVIDVIHRTIYGFFDIVADDSEEPISEKDKLLLKVNKAVCNAIKEIPIEERKTGKWIDYKDEHQCSVCGEVVIADVYNGEWGSNGIYEYCPYCGAKMEGAEE